MSLREPTELFDKVQLPLSSSTDPCRGLYCSTAWLCSLPPPPMVTSSNKLILMSPPSLPYSNSQASVYVRKCELSTPHLFWDSAAAIVTDSFCLRGEREWGSSICLFLLLDCGCDVTTRLSPAPAIVPLPPCFPPLPGTVSFLKPNPSLSCLCQVSDQ